MENLHSIQSLCTLCTYGIFQKIGTIPSIPVLKGVDTDDWLNQKIAVVKGHIAAIEKDVNVQIEKEADADATPPPTEFTDFTA